MAQQQQHAEIIEQVGLELGRMGIRGTLLVAKESIELHGAGAPVSIGIDGVLSQWALLPPEMRARRVTEIARRLAAARRSSGDSGSGDSGDPEVQKRVIGAVAAFFGLLIVVGAVRFAIPRLSAPPKPEPKAPTEGDPARRERLAHACDAVRERMGRGANFGPFALEGFVVELWLANKGSASLRQHPAITSLVAGEKLAPMADEKLATVLGGEVAIVDGLDPAASSRWAGWNAVTIQFKDGFGRAFFEDENRPRFVGLADRIARAAGATHGAMFARCAHENTHAIGAWFRGPDLAGATASLVYQMGFSSDEKLIDQAAFGALRTPEGDLADLTRAAETVGDLVTGLVSMSGGSVAAGPPPTLQFALAAPTRATAATRDLARRMGIAPRE